MDHAMKFGESGHLVLIGDEDSIVIKCEGCGELLYNTKLTLKNIQGRLSEASDFMPIGKQPPVVNHKEAPPCSKCGDKWIGYSSDGTLTMSTSTGRFTAA